MAADAGDAAILALTHDSEAVPDSIQIVREKHQGDNPYSPQLSGSHPEDSYGA